jgi:hypothetical protein
MGLSERLRTAQAVCGQCLDCGGLCSQLPTEEPSVEDCLYWLSEEISCIPGVFSGVNENFVTAAIEGPLTMAKDLVDLDVVRGVSIESGVDVLLARHNVRMATHAISKKWWCSFGYDYVLAAIRANHEKVLVYYRFSF